MIRRRFEHKNVRSIVRNRTVIIISGLQNVFVFFLYFSGYRRWVRLDLGIWSGSIIFAMGNVGR